jgi:hypothetical protein
MLGMEVQQRHDGGGLEEMELDVVLGLDQQRCLSGDRDRWDTPTFARDRDSKETRGCWLLRCCECTVGLL